MDFDKIETIENGIIIKGVKNFELDHIFDCGQCFRFDKAENGNYIGVAFERVIEIEKKGTAVILYNSTKEEFEAIWRNYLDLYREYTVIKGKLSEDPILRKAVEFGHGIRILQQDPFELILSFIISANKRIPMIKKSIGEICEKWGSPITYKGKIYYSFPRVEVLKNATVEDLQSCGVGYRAKYIKNTVTQICDEMQDLDWIKNKKDDDCYEELQKFCGVGPKVADCIMLFSMCKYTAFPVDVWVKRAMQHFYDLPDVPLPKIRNFAREKFGELSGFSQQYLFYYTRENKIKL